MKSLIALVLILCCSGLAAADNLIATDYPLTDQTHSFISVDCVLNATQNPEVWMKHVAKNNPTDASDITYQKLATIEVAVPNNGDLGSSDPFLLVARKHAAYLGANMLAYESGVENKNTHRFVSLTYTAYRVQYGELLLSPSDLYELMLRPFTKSDKSKMLLNFSLCNGDIITSDNPKFKTIGQNLRVDAYYLFKGEYYSAGCSVNGKRIEDVAAGASIDADLITKLGFPPSKKCQDEIKSKQIGDVHSN